ncbi:hypothetical protein llap_1020 [Limosa lapponica baueri]|uniref:Uncharacterized protein n=1 Tax=Limosa lapponica baueri TaxID=1758121 RepID=A0A2I0URN8_LIMLA|nr:hypothetical protein llap_1020 [Limosa lapponica baueri]
MKSETMGVKLGDDIEQEGGPGKMREDLGDSLEWSSRMKFGATKCNITHSKMHNEFLQEAWKPPIEKKGSLVVFVDLRMVMGLQDNSEKRKWDMRVPHKRYFQKLGIT